MKKTALLISLIFAALAHGQQMRVAVMPTVDNEDSLQYNELDFLTGKLRDIASKTLPKDRYGIMTQESIVDRMGSQEQAEKKCREASCLADLGRKISAAYIAQGRIGRFSGMLTIKVELYNSKSGNLVGTINEKAKNLIAIEGLLDSKAPDLFREILKENKPASPSQPSVAGGISGVQSGTDNDIQVGRRYLANFATEPSGAILSFNGMPAANCAKTPCSAELAEGRIRVIAVLDQYETADTTVSIKQNNQNVRIKLKANFGVLEIKPAYSEGVGKNENWGLAINGKASSTLENKLSPGKYSVKLSHRCYEDISFNAGINKGGREVFDMASHAKLKKGGLALSAEKDGKLVSEPVFVDGKRVGETPFSGSVAICSKIGIGSEKDKVDVKLEYKQTVKYVHKIQSGGLSGGVLTDARDGKKYKVVKIGNQTWMAENLNYDARGSKCYDDDPVNCKKYGKLYNWETAKKACPSGWHLPNREEWNLLSGGTETAGKRLKSKSGWNGNGNGTDVFGFSALPGGNGYSDGNFDFVGINGNWWSAGESYIGSGYNLCLNYTVNNVLWDNGGEHYLYSVRCIKD